MFFYCLFLFLGVFVLDCKARYSYDAPERSRIIVVTDFLNSSNGEKVFSFLENRGLVDVELVVLQRDGPSSFHGSFNVWSRGKKRSLWQITEKKLLPWLLVQKPHTLISVTRSTDIPTILISSRRKGLLSFTRELAIWVIQGSEGSGIILTSPGDLDSQSSFLDANHFMSRKVHSISASDLENAVVEILQIRKHNVPRRQRRAEPISNVNVTNSSIVASTNSSGMTVQPTISLKLNVTNSSISTSNNSSGIAVQLTPSYSVSVAGSSIAAATISSAMAVLPTLSPKVNVTNSSIAVSSSYSGIAVHLTPSPYVNATSSNSVTSTNSSGIAFQPTPSPNTNVTSSSMAVSTGSFGMAVLPTFSPKLNVTNSSTAASTSSSGIAIHLTLSPYVNASYSSIVVSTNSTGIAIQTTPSHSASVAGSSITASTISSAMAVLPTPSPKVNVTNSSIAASSSSSGIAIHLTPSPYVNATNSNIVVSTNSTGIAVQPTPSYSTSVAGSSIAASTNSSTMAVLPTPSPKVNVTNSSIAASSSYSGIAIHLTPSPYGNATSLSIVTSTYSSGIAVQLTRSPNVSVTISGIEESASSSGIAFHVTPSPNVNTTSSSIAASTSSSGLAIQVTSTLSVSVSAINSSIAAVANSSGVAVQLISSPSVHANSSSIAVSTISSGIAMQNTPSLNVSAVGTTVLTLASAFVMISSAATISPSPTERQPTPSSSQIVVTERPPVYENQTVVIVFDGNCKDIVYDANAKEQFLNKVVEVVRAKLGTKKSYIHASDVQCGSIEVTLTVIGASGLPNVSHQLTNLVKKGNIQVTFNGKTYIAKKIKPVQPTTTQAPTTTAPKNEVAFILYITFGSLIGFIFIVGIIVLVARCRKDKRQESFYLTADTDYELRGFQGIPRARNYSRVNYYGNPVELDATAADPDATSDEFQAHPDSYPYKVSSFGASASNDEKFDYGAAGLPVWDLSKLSKSEVARARDPKRSVTPSSGSMGSGNELLVQESEILQEDSTLAYDNPVVTTEDDTSGLEMKTDDNPRVTTFSDSASWQKKEASEERAFDREGLTEDDSS